MKPHPKGRPRALSDDPKTAELSTNSRRWWLRPTAQDRGHEQTHAQACRVRRRDTCRTRRVSTTTPLPMCHVSHGTAFSGGTWSRSRSFSASLLAFTRSLLHVSWLGPRLSHALRFARLRWSSLCHLGYCQPPAAQRFACRPHLCVWPRLSASLPSFRVFRDCSSALATDPPLRPISVYAWRLSVALPM